MFSPFLKKPFEQAIKDGLIPANLNTIAGTWGVMHDTGELTYMTIASNQTLLERRSNAISRGVGLMHSVFAARAENAEIWDVDGNRYIDFVSGIAVTNCGHRHPKLISAVEGQLAAFTHTCQHVTPYENMIELAERLNTLAPWKLPKKSAFFTSGAEAVENSIKLARAYTGRNAVISFGGGFHGRTFMAMALTGKVTSYKADFGAMMPDVCK